MSELAARIRSLENQREALRKGINFNVIDMLDRVEAKDTSLRQMLATVKKDRTKIEGTIAKLNDYMLDTLTKTWRKVSVYAFKHDPLFLGNHLIGFVGILDRYFLNCYQAVPASLRHFLDSRLLQV